MLCNWCTGHVGPPGLRGVKGLRGRIGFTGAMGATGVQLINRRVKRQAGCPGKLQHEATVQKFIPTQLCDQLNCVIIMWNNIV